MRVYPAAAAALLALACAPLCAGEPADAEHTMPALTAESAREPGAGCRPTAR